MTEYPTKYGFTPLRKMFEPDELEKVRSNTNGYMWVAKALHQPWRLYIPIHVIYPGGSSAGVVHLPISHNQTWAWGCFDNIEAASSSNPGDMLMLGRFLQETIVDLPLIFVDEKKVNTVIEHDEEIMLIKLKYAV